jgi:hypothetical protein
VLGRVEPRLWTRPLRDLTPETSFGFDVNRFQRDILGRPFDPWQEWLTIHAGELLPDGTPRFRVVIVVVARQNGKTEVPVGLSLYWQVVEQVGLVLGTSTKLDYAKESWTKAVELAERAPGLADMVPSHRSVGAEAHKRRRLWLRESNGETASKLAGTRYKIAAANSEGGRSLTVARAILDELRQHHDYSAWDAVIPAGNAVDDFQAWCLSNAGTSQSVVLNDERDAAIKFIETGEGDERTGLFEWSAPDGASPLDVDALAQANPNLGRRVNLDGLLSQARKAVLKGGDKLAGFRTESMCQTVPMLEHEIEPEAWDELADPDSQIVGRPAFSVETALDQSAACIGSSGWRNDGLVHTEVIDDRPGTAWVPERFVELVRRWRPLMIALDPSSPAAFLAAPIRKALREAKLDEDIVHTMTAAELAASFGGLKAHANERTIRHLGQPQVRAALAEATTRPVGDGGKAWGRRRSGRDIRELVAATSAAWALLEKQPDPPKRAPEVW